MEKGRVLSLGKKRGGSSLTLCAWGFRLIPQLCWGIRAGRKVN